MSYSTKDQERVDKIVYSVLFSLKLLDSINMQSKVDVIVSNYNKE